jgi:hypothetical protein
VSRYCSGVTASLASLDDLDWIIARLAERRAPLVALAPIFWRPAPDAVERHQAFIEHLLTEGGGLAYRTADSVLVASPRGDGWLVDDLHVHHGRWTTDGIDLWNALAADHRGQDVRLVCPRYELDRAAFASSIGLRIAETWWLIELGTGGGEARVTVSLPGADAITVGAPPVYAPPGPMLFLPSLQGSTTAVPAALDRAPELGCAGIVVNQIASDQGMVEVLHAAGLRPHCDYFTGIIDTI